MIEKISKNIKISFLALVLAGTSCGAYAQDHRTENASSLEALIESNGFVGYAQFSDIRDVVEICMNYCTETHWARQASLFAMRNLAPFGYPKFNDFQKRQVTVFCFEQNGHRQPIIVAYVAEDSQVVKNMGYIGFKRFQTQVDAAGNSVSVFAQKADLVDTVNQNINELVAIHSQVMPESQSVFVHAQGKAASFFIGKFPCLKYSIDTQYCYNHGPSYPCYSSTSMCQNPYYNACSYYKYSVRKLNSWGPTTLGTTRMEYGDGSYSIYNVQCDATMLRLHAVMNAALKLSGEHVDYVELAVSDANQESCKAHLVAWIKPTYATQIFDGLRAKYMSYEGCSGSLCVSAVFAKASVMLPSVLAFDLDEAMTSFDDGKNKPFLSQKLGTFLEKQPVIESWSYDINDSWAKELFQSQAPSVSLAYDKTTGSFAAHVRGEPLMGDMEIWSECFADGKAAIHVDMQAPRETIMRAINLQVVGKAVGRYAPRCKVRAK